MSNHQPLRRAPATLAVLAATVLAVTAAGCGGSTSAETKWAGDVCSAVTTWKDKVQQAAGDVRTTLQSPKAGMRAAIEADLRTAVAATNTLASDLKSLEPPNTDAGKHAKQQLDALAAQLQTTMQSAKQTLAGVPENAGAVETTKALVPLAPSLQSLGAKTTSALDAVQASGKALKDGFKSADSCKPYR